MQQRPHGLQSSKYLLEKFAGLEVAPAQSSAAHRGTMGAPRDAVFSSSHIDQHEKTQVKFIVMIYFISPNPKYFHCNI